METQEIKRHEASLSIAITLTAAALATAFHFLFFPYQYGIAFALFMVILMAGVHTLTILTGKRGNMWAYLFAIPLFLALIAEILYASEVVRTLGFVTSIASFTLFTFWFTTPAMKFWDVSSLWPMPLFIESFLPFKRFGTYASDIVKNRHNLSKVIIGIAIAIPFLLVIGVLFVSADAFIQKTLSDFFGTQNLQQAIGRTIWDIFAFIFFASAGSMMISRLSEGRRPEHRHIEHHTDHVIASTFLISLNILFAIFIGFQIVYFFGGETFVREHGLVYASYAREGFFQLLWVAIIVTGVIAAIYRITGMRHWLIRSFSILLILQTGVVIVSALRRMMLYIDTYGLSVQRFWAISVIYVIAAILLMGIIGMIGKFAYLSIVKGIAVCVLAPVSASLLINVESMVAHYNVDRFLAGTSNQMDIAYLTTLSSDAVPALVKLAEQQPDIMIANPREIEAAQRIAQDPEIAQAERDAAQQQYQSMISSTTLRETLRVREEELQKLRTSDWRNLVFSDYNALAALGGMRNPY